MKGESIFNKRSITLKLCALSFFLLLVAGCKEEVAAVKKTQPTPPGTVQAKAKKVTFIELGSVKCVPCRLMQPIMDEIARDFKGQVKVVFHDVWTPEGQPVAKKYQIRAIPTQIFLDEKGEEYYRHVGFFPKDDLVRVLKHKGVK